MNPRISQTYWASLGMSSHPTIPCTSLRTVPSTHLHTSKHSRMIGPHDTEGKKRPRAQSETDSQTAPSSSVKKSHKSSKKSKKDAVLSEEEEEHVKGSSDGEIPLGKRLEQLSRQMAALEQERDSSLVDNSDKKKPSADSLVTLLDQALQSGDSALLEQCLSYTDLDIIDTTTRVLPTHRVLKLLKVLVAKFEKRPSRGLLVTRWISSILKNHLAYLITVPDLSVQLAGLSQMLEQRLQAYTRLSSLAGRLDLLMSQISSKKLSSQLEAAGGSATESLQPKAVYQD